MALCNSSCQRCVAEGRPGFRAVNGLKLGTLSPNPQQQRVWKLLKLLRLLLCVLVLLYAKGAG
eukprot:4096008-Amphidinium_carterae.1